MKCFAVALVIGFSFLAFSFASPIEFLVESKEAKALQECNATHPVQRNVRQVINAGIATGERIKISQEEKCHLYCFLQKVGFFGPNGNIQIQKLIQFVLKQSPELAKYSDVMIAQSFQIMRSTKGFEDNCQKAFVVFHQFTQYIFSYYVADGLVSTGIQDAIIEKIENGKQIDQEIKKSVEGYLKFFDVFITAIGTEIQKNADAQVSQAQSQISNAQSQGSSLQQQASAAGVI